MISFKVNEYISLKLEEGKTMIFVKGEEFLTCKTILLNVPLVDASDIVTMDDLFEKSELIEGEDLKKHGIDIETEFWAHCSNLQVWVENEYNTDLLESKLAFPLLKRLTDVGDISAKRKFKEEIARRYKHGSDNTQQFLKDEFYLEYLSFEELLSAVLDTEEAILLLEIIDFMEDFGITYELADDLKEDKCRHRYRLERFFTVSNGHVCDFEFDIFKESLELAQKLSLFKELNYLLLIVGCKIRNLSMVPFKLVRILKMVINVPILIPDVFDAFPNLTSLIIHNRSHTKDCLISLKSLAFLKELRHLELYDFFNGVLSEEILFIKKQKGLDISISIVNREIIPETIEVEVDYPADIDLSNLLKVHDVKERVYLIIERFTSEGNGISFKKLKEILKIPKDNLTEYIEELAMDSLIYHCKKNVFKVI